MNEETGTTYLRGNEGPTVRLYFLKICYQTLLRLFQRPR